MSSQARDGSTPYQPRILPLPLIEVSGGPRERGRQYGEQAAARIRGGIAHYSAQLEAAKLPWGEVEVLVARFEPTIHEFAPAYIEEMHGIAEGAGLPYAAIVLLNARTEILKLAELREHGVSVPMENDGCTGIVILPQATAAGRLLHAQNWDWKAECAETSVVLKIRNGNGPDILTFTEAGGLARSGFNSAGISITANYLETDRDYRRLGVPLALIRRKVLEQRHLAPAMHAVYTTPKSGSNNMMVAQANGIAINFECAPDETFQVLPNNRLIVHANHFQSPVALTKLVDRGILDTPDSLYRDLRAHSLLEPHMGAMTVDIVKAVLFDDFEAPLAICRPPHPEGGNLSATVAMIAMEPALGVMDVAILPALNRSFETYKLDMSIQKPNG